MKIYIFNRKNYVWSTDGAVAIIAESQAIAEALYRRELGEIDFEFEIQELEITSGLMLIAQGYDCTTMKFKNLSSPL